MNDKEKFLLWDCPNIKKCFDEKVIAGSFL